MKNKLIIIASSIILGINSLAFAGDKELKVGDAMPEYKEGTKVHSELTWKGHNPNKNTDLRIVWREEKGMVRYIVMYTLPPEGYGKPFAVYDTKKKKYYQDFRPRDNKIDEITNKPERVEIGRAHV